MSIEGQGHFLTLAQGRVHTKIKPNFLRNHCAILNQNLYEKSFQVQGYVKKVLTLCWSHDQDGRNAHMYGKNPSKIFFFGTGRPISTKLGM